MKDFWKYLTEDYECYNSKTDEPYNWQQGAKYECKFNEFQQTITKILKDKDCFRELAEKRCLIALDDDKIKEWREEMELIMKKKEHPGKQLDENIKNT